MGTTLSAAAVVHSMANSATIECHAWLLNSKLNVSDLKTGGVSVDVAILNFIAKSPGVEMCEVECSVKAMV